MPKTNLTPEERFWQKVNKTDTCWIWVGSKNDEAYGNFNHNGTVVKAHRFAYELLKGPIPKDRELDHLCRNPSCVNPEHLEAVTHQENMKRGHFFNTKKTHCPRGHEYTGRNTRGSRLCKICMKTWREEDINYVKEFKRQYYLKNREKILENSKQYYYSKKFKLLLKSK
jgi:hypothetical protein